MDGPAGHFCKMNILLVMLAYVLCQTSIPYSKNGLMREYNNVFIIYSGRYLDNFNNMLTDFDIFRAITSTCLNNMFKVYQK